MNELKEIKSIIEPHEILLVADIMTGQEALRIAQRFNELLDVSRLEQGRMQFDMQPIDISKVISQVASELKVKADEKKLKITYKELPDPKPKIFADPDRSAQIFDNVLLKGVKDTGSRYRFDLTLRLQAY